MPHLDHKISHSAQSLTFEKYNELFKEPLVFSHLSFKWLCVILLLDG